MWIWPGHDVLKNRVFKMNYSKISVKQSFTSGKKNRVIEKLVK